MNTSNKISLLGIVLLVSGIIGALINFGGSTILQYIFVAASLGIASLGVMIGKTSRASPIPATYFLWIGFAVAGLSIALVAGAASMVMVVTTFGFFLLALAFIEFGFALQILNHQANIPWKVIGLKLALSATAAIGAASILKIAGLDVYFGLLFLGVLFGLVGLTFIQMGRSVRNPTSSASRS
jgi:hypothetical protein